MKGIESASNGIEWNRRMEWMIEIKSKNRMEHQSNGIVERNGMESNGIEWNRRMESNASGRNRMEWNAIEWNRGNGMDGINVERTRMEWN